MAFLSRFQWATVFGAKSRHLARASLTETMSTSTLQRLESRSLDRSQYRDNATRTSNEGSRSLTPSRYRDRSTQTSSEDSNDLPNACCGPAEQTPESNQDKLLEEMREEANESDEPAATFDEQSAREENYVIMVDEAEDDHTAGPSRLVMATDGLKSDCPALLMTLELSGLVQQAIYADKRFSWAERLEVSQKVQLRSLESAVKSEIRAHEYRARQIRSGGSARSEHSSAPNKELENLRLMLGDIEGRRRTAAAQLATEAMYLRDCNKALAVCLEEAFTAAELVKSEEEFPTTEVERLDLQQEYLAFCQQLKEMEEGSQASSVAALQVKGDTHLLVPEQNLTSEQELEAALKNNVFSTRDRVRTAAHKFEQRELVRQQEKQTTDEDEESFDLRWVQRISNLTRELIEAEKASATARAAALDRGLIIVTEDQVSGFGSTDDDGYPMSLENDWIVTTQSSNIVEWIDQVDEKAPSEVGSVPNMDDWDAKSVEGHDSGSVVHFGHCRPKIDAWQQDCHQLRLSLG